MASVFVNSVPLGYMSVVPLVYLLEIGYSPVTIGVIYAASGIANTVGYAPFGFFADRFGRKRFLIIGSVLPALAYGIFGLTLNPLLLIVASIVGGVGLAGGLATAISSPSLLPLLADSSPNEHRTPLFAAYQGVYTVGLSAGSFLSFLPSLLGSSLSQTSVTAHSESYFIMSLLILGSVIPLLFVTERRKGRAVLPESVSPQSTALQGLVSGERPNEESSSERGRGAVTSWSKIAKFSLIMGISGLGFGTIIQLLPTWYNLKFGVSEGTVGFWMAAAQLLSLVALPTIPFLVRRRGTVNVAVTAGLVSCIPLIIMPFSVSFELAASLFVARSIFMSINVPVFQSYVAGAVSERERATTFGVVFTAWGVSNSIGTFLAGDLLGANLLILPFVIGVAAYLGYSTFFFFFFRGRRLPEEMQVSPVVPDSIPPSHFEQV